MSHTLTLALLLAAAVLLVAVGAVRLSTRLGLPSLLVYLALGVAIGEAGLGIRFNDANLTRTRGTCALAVIISEGGLTPRWTPLRPVLGGAAVPAAGLYPLAAVGLTVLADTVGTLAQASGFLAVYTAGVVLGNARLPHRHSILGFTDGLAWLAQIGLFVLLGLLVSPGRLP